MQKEPVTPANASTQTVLKNITFASNLHLKKQLSPDTIMLNTHF